MTTHHLVCENTVETIVVKGDEPIKTLELIRTHCPTNDSRQASTRRNAKGGLQPTARRLFKDIGLVVAIHCCFAVLEHFLILFFFRLAMASRFVSN
jgi:hypothetical protein